jgi:hypothetical protein
MDSSSEKKSLILIFEDSRADRARFRLLFPGKETEYEFAWAWKPKEGCSVFNWFERESGQALSLTDASVESDDKQTYPGKSLRNLLDKHKRLQQSLSSFKLLFLDLAWTNPAEAVMQNLQHLSRQQGNELAKGNPATNSDLQNLVDNVEGIALLEWLKDNGWNNNQNPLQPAIWVTSAYVPMTAVGMRVFLKVRYGLQGGLHLFHKWMDDAPLVSDLISFLTGLKKEKQR